MVTRSRHVSARLVSAAAAALAWLEERGMTTTGAVNTALIDLAQARGMASADIETRIGSIEERLSRLEEDTTP